MTEKYTKEMIERCDELIATGMGNKAICEAIGIPYAIAALRRRVYQAKQHAEAAEILDRLKIIAGASPTTPLADAIASVEASR
jgi:hypothetical protein